MFEETKNQIEKEFDESQSFGPDICEIEKIYDLESRIKGYSEEAKHKYAIAVSKLKEF